MPNSRITYGCETPASRAISSVFVPAYPDSPNAMIAASSTSSPRSAAVSLVLVMVAMLSVNAYSACYQSITTKDAL